MMIARRHLTGGMNRTRHRIMYLDSDEECTTRDGLKIERKSIELHEKMMDQSRVQNDNEYPKSLIFRIFYR
jgi:hypothetical protein